MNKLTFTDKTFNSLSEQDLNNSLVLVTHDGSDIITKAWSGIVSDIKELEGPAGHVKNSDLLDNWMRSNDCNGNNTELLFAQDGEIYKLTFK